MIEFKKSPLVQEAFVVALLERICSVTSYPPPHYEEQTSQIEWNGYLFSIENLYSDYMRFFPEKGHALLDLTVERIIRCLESDSEDSVSFEEAQPSLLPVVRLLGYLENLGGEPTAYQSIHESLGVAIALNCETSFSYLSESWLQKNGVDFETIYNVALKNLESLNEGNFEELFPGVWRSSWKDGYDPSRILLSFHTTKQLALKGEAVFFIPHREVLLITGSLDTEGLRQAIAFCEAYHNLPHAITPVPFALLEQEGEAYYVDVFSVSEEHPLFEEISQLA